MKTSARVIIGMVVILFGTILLPRPASQVVAPYAHAGSLKGTLSQILPPLPTLPPILPTPTPPDDDPLPGGDGGDGGGGGGGGDGGSTGGGSAGGDSGGGVIDGGGSTDKPGDKPRNGQAGKGGSPQGDIPAVKPPKGTYVPMGGSYTTDNLVAVANELRALGVPLERIVRDVYAPFIIGGKAAWTDSWGAPRYGPGPIVRTHEGQDVFCSYGDPVMATEPGIVSYGDGGLGGKVARLFRDDGGYWYYAHLSDFNEEEFPLGSSVEVGDIIGYCGNTGNAISTPSHVHFGYYGPDGEARNPMQQLVKWLHIAERRSGGSITQVQGERVRHIESLTLARRFGDSFVPDQSELTDASEQLLSSTGSPATGAFGVAQSALMAALSSNLYEGGFDPYAADLGSTSAEFDEPLTAGDQLDAILEESAPSKDSQAGG